MVKYQLLLWAVLPPNSYANQWIVISIRAAAYMLLYQASRQLGRCSSAIS